MSTPNTRVRGVNSSSSWSSGVSPQAGVPHPLPEHGRSERSSHQSAGWKHWSLLQNGCGPALQWRTGRKCTSHVLLLFFFSRLVLSLDQLGDFYNTLFAWKHAAFWFHDLWGSHLEALKLLKNNSAFYVHWIFMPMKLPRRAAAASAAVTCSLEFKGLWCIFGQHYSVFMSVDFYLVRKSAVLSTGCSELIASEANAWNSIWLLTECFWLNHNNPADLCWISSQ